MKNILHMLKKDLKRILKDPLSVFAYVLLPVFLITMGVLLNNKPHDSVISIGIVNKDKGSLSQEMTAYMENAGRFEFTNLKDEEVNKSIMDKRVDCAITIQDGFSESVYGGKPDKINVTSLKGEDVTEFVKSYVENYVSILMDFQKASRGDRKLFDKMITEYNQGKMSMKVENVDDRTQGRATTLFSIGALITCIMFCSGGVARNIIEEKKDRTYYRICMAPVKKREYLLANLIANFIMLTVQVVISTFVIENLFHVDILMTKLQFFGILFTFGIAAIMLNIMVVSFSSSSRQASTMLTIITIPTCMLGGCYWDPGLMPSSMQRLAAFTPQKWAIDAVTKVQSGGTFQDVKINLGIILLFAVTFMTASLYAMKMKDVSNDLI